MGPFKEYIRRMVIRGHFDKGKKLSGEHMLEQLEAFYPHRFDLPTVYRIKLHVNTVLRGIKKAVKALRDGLTEIPGRRNQFVPDHYASVIEKIVSEHRQDFI